MGWFIQTATFVIFNKVCTSQVCAVLSLRYVEIDAEPRSQYFLWYMLFLPLIIPSLSWSWSSSIKYLACWMGTQVLWLSQAYRVEFLGEPIFFAVLSTSLDTVGYSRVL
jgi:phosphatidylinositol glycan class M